MNKRQQIGNPDKLDSVRIELAGKIDKLDERINQKVPNSTFNWTIGIIITLALATFSPIIGYAFYQINKLSDKYDALNDKYDALSNETVAIDTHMNDKKSH